MTTHLTRVKGVLYIGALQHQGFRRYTLTRYLALMGGVIQVIGIGIAVFEQSPNVWSLYRSFLFWLIPFMVGVMLGGLLADRFPKRTVLIVTFGVQMLQAVLLALMQGLGMITLLVLYTVLVFAALFEGMGSSAEGAIFLEMFPDQEAASEGQQELRGMRLNARYFILFSAQMSKVVGSMITGILPMNIMFRYNAILFVPMLLVLLRMKEGRRVYEEKKMSVLVAWRFLKESRNSWSAMKWHTLVRSMSGYSQILLPLIGLAEFGSRTAYSRLMTAFAIGGIVGSLFGIWITRRGEKQGLMRFLIWCMLSVASFMIFDISPVFEISMCLAIVVSFTMTGVWNSGNVLITSVHDGQGREIKEAAARFQTFFSCGSCVGDLVACTVVSTMVELTGNIRWAAGWSLLGWIVLILGLSCRLRLKHS